MTDKQREKGKIKLSHRVEYLLCRIFFAVFGLLKPDTASNIGGWLGRTIGYRMGITKKADRNLRHAMPEFSRQERQDILLEMWDNLGRVISEYPHLLEISDPKEGRVVFEGQDELDKALADGERATILAGGHLGNCEVVPIAAAERGVPSTIIVRTPNNPLVGDYIDKIRQANGVITTPKGAGAARTAMKIVKQKGVLGLLFDQRLSEGIDAMLFGKRAVTATAHVVLALNNRARLIPVETYRTGPARFHVKIHPAMTFEKSDRPKEEIIREGVQAMNDHLESWIRQRPASWFWLSNRFPKSDLAPQKDLSQGPKNLTY